MCGIFAYLFYSKPTTRENILKVLLNGLKRQEYRGYDSAGLAIDDDSLLDDHFVTRLIKTNGKVADLENLAMSMPDIKMDQVFETHLGIAHTRWATHGKPCPLNSHPQTSDASNQFVCVHNGIISNHRELKKLLISKNYYQSSETDTEIIVMLMKYFYDKAVEEGKLEEYNLVALLDQVLEVLEGAFSIVIKSRLFPGQCVAIRRSSPLVIGLKTETHKDDTVTVPVVSYHIQQGAERVEIPKNFHYDAMDSICNGPIEYFIASDASALVEHTNQVTYLEENDIAYINNGRLSIHRRRGLNQSLNPSKFIEFETLKLELQQIMKGNHSSFMKKEIFEQPETVFNTMRGRVNFSENRIDLGGIQKYLKVIRKSSRINLIGCGTSYYSALAVRKIMEEMSQIPVSVDIASDFLDREPYIDRNSVCIFISQSGETADTLSALRRCKQSDALVIGVTNVVGSSISRETICGVHVNAGPEIGVGSTKAYTSQIVALIMIACKLGQDSVEKADKINSIIQGLNNLPQRIAEVLQKDNIFTKIAEKIHNYTSILTIGRGCHYATCLEGALKIKEITYCHAEGILAGELKHGPLALVDEFMPIIYIVMQGSSFDKSLNGLKQIVARNSKPLIVTDCWSKISDIENCGVFEIPSIIECLQPVLAVIPFQLLALHMAEFKKLDVDCPRNLAKSVTVE